MDSYRDLSSRRKSQREQTIKLDEKNTNEHCFKNLFTNLFTIRNKSRAQPLMTKLCEKGGMKLVKGTRTRME